MPETTADIVYGWPNTYVEYYSNAVMHALGVAKAVTCSNGTEHRPKELWSATNVGLAHLVLIGEWEGVAVTLTPWCEVRGLELTAKSSEARTEPTALLKLANPQLELDVAPSSSTAGSRGQQWPFVQAVLEYLGGR